MTHSRSRSASTTRTMRCFLLLLSLSLVMGFAPIAAPSRSTTELQASSRRAAFAELAMGFAAATLLVAPAAEAADGSTTTWLTGKAPKVPGEKPKDKSETKDTRRDPSFLRSISDCKSQCEQTPGPDGLARAKEECLQDCQDICCKSYEQCTFAIVPR